jgi:multisubunit Na+/H+ antiporter MnhC subunit
MWLDADHETPDRRHPWEGDGVSCVPSLSNGQVTVTTTIFALCTTDAPANCEDATDPMGTVVVLVAMVAGTALLTLLEMLAGPTASHPGTKSSARRTLRGRRSLSTEH